MRAKMLAKSMKAIALIFLGFGMSNIINDRRMRLIPKTPRLWPMMMLTKNIMGSRMSPILLMGPISRQILKTTLKAAPKIMPQ
jgi:hypothetical protein